MTTTTMAVMLRVWQVACRCTQTAAWSSAMFVAPTPGGTCVDRALDLLCRRKPPPSLTSPVSTNNSHPSSRIANESVPSCRQTRSYTSQWNASNRWVAYCYMSTVSECCLIKLLTCYFIWKMHSYFSIGNGQHCAICIGTLSFGPIAVWYPLDNEHWKSYSFYRAMLCIRDTSHGPVSVRPSEVGVLLKRLTESSWFLAYELPSTRPTLC